jgi:DNA-binding NarL/FixJ family response regulator
MRKEIMTNPISVRILIDEPLRATGVAAILKPEPGLSVRPFAPDEPCDVVVADLNRAADKTLQSLIRASTGYGAVAVVLTDGQNIRPAELAAAGVIRIVHSEATANALIAAVKEAGAATATPQQQRLVELERQLEHIGEASAALQTRPWLSEREISVLRHLAEGCDTAEIARKTHLSERNIKYVLAGLMRRFNLRNRVHAVAFAIRSGYV